VEENMSVGVFPQRYLRNWHIFFSIQSLQHAPEWIHLTSEIVAACFPKMSEEI
jgi:hypothetical protein